MKKNMSIFYNQKGFETYPADILINDNNSDVKWNGNVFKFFITEGHSDACICILIGNDLFTGDTIIKESRTVTKLPGGSKFKLIDSLCYLDSIFLGKQIKIHSGHGESFMYDDKNNYNII